MSDIVIRVEHVSKQYRLGEIGGASMREDINRWWARKRGRAHRPISVDGPRPQSEDYHWALRDVSFDVTRGDILGIIGRNGAGKSTLLKLLSRITAPTSGTLKIRGRVASLLEVGTGFHGELTGRENIFLNGAILGMTRAEIRRRFDEIVAFSECEEFIGTPVKRYSSGMYVRLAFAVAAHLEAEILIVDEVLAVGDMEFQQKCLGKIGDVAQGGRTVLFVSHNLPVVETLCKRSLLLAGGCVESQGPTSAVIERYRHLGQGSVVTLGVPVSLAGAKRWGGSGVARIDSILPFDPHNPGSIVPIYRKGDIGFRFFLSGDVSSVTGAAIQICDLSDRKIVNFNTLEDGSKLRLGPRDTVSVVFRGLSLRPGSYKVGFWIGAGASHIDVVIDSCMLEVLPPVGRRWVSAHDGFYECRAEYFVESIAGAPV